MNGPANAALTAGSQEGDVLSEGTPDVPLAWAIDLLARQYGLAGRLSPLTGERDRNFLLETLAASYMLRSPIPPNCRW